MRSRRIVKKEKSALYRESSRMAQAIDAVLQAEFKRKFPFFRLRLQNRFRLLVIRSWMVKYRVPLSFILKTLIPFWEERQKKRRRFKSVFGTSIATLTGKVSEDVLRQKIERTYPNGEHIAEWREEEKSRVLSLEPQSRPVRITEFKTVRQFARAYRKRIERRAAQWQNPKVIAEMKKRPFRGNPWTE